MTIPLPLFVAVPLAAAFLTAMFSEKLRSVATLIANCATVILLVFAIASIGQARMYQVGKWPIPLGINLPKPEISIRFGSRFRCLQIFLHASHSATDANCP